MSDDLEKPGGAAARVALRVLQTSDLHGHLMAYDYAGDRPQPGVGLVRTAALIAAAREEAANSLLVDCGDFLFGDMLADDWVAAPAPRDPNPVIRAMNALDYAAVALGNHEFNFGLGPLSEALSQARFPVLCSNLSPVRGGVPLAARSGLMLHRRVTDDAGRVHELRIGLLSVLPPQVMQWDAAHLSGRVQVRGMVGAARAGAAGLRAAGADLVIVLNHSGLGDGSDDPGAENAGLALARLDDIDAVLCAHKHRLFPGPYYRGRAGVDARAGTLWGKPAAMPGCWGSHLAVIDLDLVRGAGGWRVAGHRTALRPIAERVKGAQVPQVADAPALVRLATPAHRATLGRMRREVGRVETGVTTHFSQVAPCRVTALVAAAQLWRARDLLAGRAHPPILSAAAPFRCGGTGGPGNYTGLPAGPVRVKDIAAIYPFPNTLRVVAVSGAQILDWLEQAAAQFHRLEPGRPRQPLLRDDFPSYDFDVLHGLRYAIDPGRPARFDPAGRLLDPRAARVTGVSWNGAPLDPGMEFWVLTNSYRAGGGGGFAALSGAGTVLEVDEAIPGILTDYLRAGHTVPAGAAAVWRFAALPGVEALLRTAPGAVPPGGIDLRPAGMGADGFARFVLRF